MPPEPEMPSGSGAERLNLTAEGMALGVESGRVVVRPAVDTDVDVVLDLERRQEIGWWGEPESERDEVETCFEMVRMTCGDLASGSFVAVVDDAPVGFAALIGHGDAVLAVDPAHPASGEALAVLAARLVAAGVATLDAPQVDPSRIAAFAEFGFTPMRSSFDLERDGNLDDVARGFDVPLPDGLTFHPFEPERDDVAVHTMLYDFWTDVPGHRFRGLDEWRTIFLDGDPGLVVVARRSIDDPPVGVAVCRSYADGMGWVSQLGVARSARGLGLGLAVLVEACRRLVDAGASRIGLSVEAVNRSALGLYEGVGFRIDREWVHCTNEGAGSR